MSKKGVDTRWSGTELLAAAKKNIANTSSSGDDYLSRYFPVTLTMLINMQLIRLIECAGAIGDGGGRWSWRSHWRRGDQEENCGYELISDHDCLLHYFPIPLTMFINI